jgi:type VI secretion system secreted protein VgrG
MAFQLIHTTIRVEGNDADIIFSNLMINQQMADVNSFNFTWRQPEGETSLSAHISFYSDHLAKEVTITIGDNFTFKGIIYAINCSNQDSLGVSYDISGKGLFEKLNQVPECRSFYKKNITQIFNAVNNTEGTTLNLSPSNNSELFYTVQYNQSGFSFFRMMAARYGEWFYYNGTEMVLGAPTGDTITITEGTDINHIDISAKLVKSPQNNTSFDRHTGEEIAHQPQSSSGSGFIGAAQHAGETAYGGNQSMTNISAAATPQLLTDMSTLSQRAAAASAVILRAGSNNIILKLADKIKIMDAAGHSAGEYYITEVHHNASTDSNYQNQFVAVPAEVEVPPYTNPFIVPLCKAQPAKIVDNEDADGLDRVKVHFPWQGSQDNTPWLNVVTPHAGKDKGIRFLPEVGEEVLVDFLDNNAERPFVLGAIHTEQNKSGEGFEGNNLKVIGTATGRRFVINDEEGFLFLMDNFSDETPRNLLAFKRNDDNTQIVLESMKDDNNVSIVQLNNSDSLKIGVSENGSMITEILLEKAGKKITIHSKGSIELNADQSISLNAANININASQELNMEGKAKAVSVKGMKVELTADTTMDVKGLTTTVEGTAKADFKAGGPASVKGAIVMIN